jgi:hypothetical protein
MLGAWSFVSHDDSAAGAAFVCTLARALAVRGRRVLLFDLCPSFPALDIALDVAHRVVYTLSDALHLSAEDVFLSPERQEGRVTVREEKILFVPIAVGEVPSAEAVRACILAADADVVLMTAERGSLSVAREVSDGLILTTRADAPSLRAAIDLASFAAFDGFVLSDFIPSADQIEREPSPTQLSDMLSLPIMGILPRAELKSSLVPKEKDFRIAVVNMAGRILGERVPLLEDVSISGMRRRAYFERILR